MFGTHQRKRTDKKEGNGRKKKKQYIKELFDKKMRMPLMSTYFSTYICLNWSLVGKSHASAIVEGLA